MVDRILRHDRDCLVNQFNRRVILIELARHDAQHVEGIRVAGELGENLAIQAFGIGQAARGVMSDGLGEELVGGLIEDIEHLGNIPSRGMGR